MDDEMPSLRTHAGSKMNDFTLESHSSLSNGNSSHVSVHLSPSHVTDKGDGHDRSPLKAEGVKPLPHLDEPFLYLHHHPRSYILMFICVVIIGSYAMA